MKRHCLFIDDDIEEFDSVIQKLPGIAKASLGIEVTYDKLNPMDKKFRDKKDDIDLNKIEDDFVSRISDKKYDLIACDYDLGDEESFGTDIIKRYRQRDRKFVAVIYSADLRQIVRSIISANSKNGLDYTLNKVTGLITTQISRFFNKSNNLMDDLSPMLFAVTPEKQIENVLLQFKGLTFSHGFSNFSGIQLSEIANHVRQDTHEGRKFVEEMIERGITHFIDLNK
jgi:hypothetical protein